MKPSSALILDQDGIILLHRTGSGWFFVGRADPSGDQLDEEMAFLRSTARELTGGKFATKLVIPNSQLLYKRLEIGDVAAADKQAAVREALDGLTPYGVDELAFDWREAPDGQIDVAVVAEKTLAEAEEFATRYKFNPICFVAVPEPGSFEGEPYFGQTSTAHLLVRPGGRVERDAAPIDLEAVLRSLNTGEPPEAAVSAVMAASAEAGTVKGTEETGEDPDAVGPAPDDEAVPAASEDSSAKDDDDARKPQPQAAEPDPAAPAFTSSRTAQETGGDALDLKWVSPELAPQDDGHRIAAQAETAEAQLQPFKHVPVEADRTPVIREQSSAMPKVAVPPLPAAHVPETRTPPSLRPANRPGYPIPPGITAPLRTAERKSGLRGISPIWIMLLLGALAAAGLTLTVSYLVSGTDRNEALLTAPEAEDLAFLDRLPEELPPESDAPDAEALADADLTEMDIGDPVEAEAEPDETLAAIPDPLEAPTTVPVEDAESTMAVDIEPAPKFDRMEAAPQGPEFPSADRIDTLYVASIDRTVISHDAVAIPGADLGDEPLRVQPNPPGPDVEFVLDDRGMVVPSPDGALTPEGVLVYAGEPSVRPLPRPGSNVILAPAALSPERRIELAALRPVARPGGLAETDERARLAGLSRSELAGLRPVPRPEGLAPVADTTPTEAAVVASLRPVARPNGLQRAVERAVQEAQSAAAAPASAPPPVPSGASVTQAATIRGGVKLNAVSLIGVYGQSSSRRALVRLTSGRFVMVEVGDRLDGGRVTAISDSALSYTKSGRSVKLDMPRG